MFDIENLLQPHTLWVHYMVPSKAGTQQQLNAQILFQVVAQSKNFDFIS